MLKLNNNIDIKMSYIPHVMRKSLEKDSVQIMYGSGTVLDQYIGSLFEEANILV